MKRQFLLIFLCLCIISVLAQGQERQTQNRKPIDAATGNLLYISQYTDVQGSPFLNDQWLQGKIILNSGASLNGLLLKFDVFNNQFIINKSDTAFVVSPVVQEVHLYTGTDTTNALVFKNGFNINTRVDSKIYLQVLADGKITLLKWYKKELEEYTEYGDATKHKRFRESFQYFIDQNGQYQTIQLSKKNLEYLLSDKWSSVATYMAQKRSSGKDEKSWIEAICFYDSL